VQTGTVLRGQHAVTEAWTVGWRIARSKEQRSDSGVSSFGPFQFDNAVHNDVNVLEVEGTPLAGWRMQLGVERLTQSTDIASYTRQKRDTDVLRAGVVHDADWGSVQANLRHDKTSDFGSATTGLLGGSVKLGAGLSVVASASTSFTPPTLDFLFYDCSPFTCSNPSLRPEKARNVEAGVQWQDARTLLRATVFAMRARDKIANDANFVPQNLNRVKNNGLELSARHAMAPWTLIAEATFQNPVDESTGERLLRRAREQAALRVDYQHGPWQAGAGLRHVGARPDSGGVTLGSYAVVDASAQWQVDPAWSVQARVDNLFDRHYEPAFGYNGTPRGAFVGLNWSPR
jgi:vitamin B12 transporter